TCAPDAANSVSGRRGAGILRLAVELNPVGHGRRAAPLVDGKRGGPTIQTRAAIFFAQFELEPNLVTIAARVLVCDIAHEPPAQKSILERRGAKQRLQLVRELEMNVAILAN